MTDETFANMALRELAVQVTSLKRKADAADAYVAARVANDGATVDNWNTALARVDNAWHDLRIACGFGDGPVGESLPGLEK